MVLITWTFSSFMITTWRLHLYTLFWSLLLKARALILCRLVCFLKHQTCWWSIQYVRVFLYYQITVQICWDRQYCLYQNENGCFFLLEFIFVNIHWNMVILVLSHIVYPHFHFCDSSYFEASLTFTLVLQCLNVWFSVSMNLVQTMRTDIFYLVC